LFYVEIRRKLALLAGWKSFPDNKRGFI